MIDKDAISEIIETYQKHGWILRRVLLSAELKQKLASHTSALFGGAAILDAEIDAAWFSRPPKSGGVVWEIRHLGNFPLALLENIDEDNAGFEDVLRDIESRLRESVAAKRSA
ncbi:MAG: hypothetical protein ABJB40_04900 [Acidobacteriota bacterium]